MLSRMVLAMVCCVLCCAVAQAADAPTEGAWLTSFAKAKETAKKEKKIILADFTGSDWCGWCIKLKAEVFDKQEFKTWASKKVVLLELDFPKRKELPADLKTQNDGLAQKYAIRGFPTILFLDEEGELIGQSGYLEGGPAAWTAEADKQCAAHAKAAPKGVGENLQEGLAAAKASNLPLLVILSGEAAADQNRVKPLLANAEFVKYTSGRIVAVKVAFPAAEGASAEEKAALAELVKKYKVSGSTYLMVDSTNSKVLLQKPIAFTTETSLVTLLGSALPKVVYGGEWLEDYAKAVELSKQTGRPMVLDFTGSDWCGWCKKLDAEVFSQEEFKKFAKENFILVTVDFPKKKQLPAALAKQNNDLAQKYQIQGFPTIIVTDATGKQLGETGYLEGGPAAFNAELKKIAGTK